MSAPTNDAIGDDYDFLLAQRNEIELVDHGYQLETPGQALIDFLKYHIVPENAPSEMFEAGKSYTLNILLQKHHVVITKVAGTIVINGNSNVTQGDIICSNGIVHKINKALNFGAVAPVPPADGNWTSPASVDSSIPSVPYYNGPYLEPDLECISDIISVTNGKTFCLEEGKALCIEYNNKPMGGKWTFGIEQGQLRLYDPNNQVVYEHCVSGIKKLCIFEKSNGKSPKLTLYGEQDQVVGKLLCDGYPNGVPEPAYGEIIKKQTILKLDNLSSVADPSSYPIVSSTVSCDCDSFLHS